MRQIAVKPLRLMLVMASALLAAPLLEAQHPGHPGLPTDWSFSHVVHHRAAGANQKDPRSIYHWLQLMRARRAAGSKGNSRARANSHTDWHFTLGAGTVASNMSPAKFNFDVNATPSCANDYVVMGLNVAGSASQPNFVGFNNLYSGTTNSFTIGAPSGGATESGSTVTLTLTAAHTYSVGQTIYVSDVNEPRYNGQYSITSIPGATKLTYTSPFSGLPGSGNGSVGLVNGLCSQGAPSVKWAYNVSTAGGSILTSPAISVDGTQVAFIESAASSAVLHVLTLGSTGTNGSFDNSSNQYAAVTPGVGGGNNASMQSVTYTATASNTRSSPFVDYDLDVAYFGDDNGNLYATNCVFTCAARGLTLGIASGWPISLGAAGTKMTSAALDFSTNQIFIGGSDGNLYMVPRTSCPGAGCASAIKSATIASNTANGALADGPIVDTTFQTVFMTTGQRNGTTAAGAVQLNESLSILATVGMGTNGFTIPNGALTDEYFNNSIGGTTATGNAIYCGPQGGSSQGELFNVSFAGKSATIAGSPVGATEAGTTVTITTTAAHGFVAGQTVVISGVGVGGYNGTFTITSVPTTTTFRYTAATSGLAASGGGTAVEKLSTVNPPLFSTVVAQAIAGANKSTCSPLVTFTNGATERLFFSQPKAPCPNGGATDGCVFDYTVAGGVVTQSTTTSEHGGTSAIIVDNVSASAQASSLYFATLTATTGGAASAPSCTYGSGNPPATAAFCAVKVTQAGLQ